MSNIDEKGLEFLNKLYPKLHISHSVLSASRNDLSLNPNQKTEKYMDKLDITHTKYRDKERAVQRLKQLYYNSYIIKEENVPESYFDLQKKIALEQGHGYIEFDTDMRKEKIQTIINNQKASLDNWINYFINKDADVYPMWAKYWAFQGMITLGSFDKAKSKFNKRTSKTTNEFIDLNREALAMAMDYVTKYNNGNTNIEDTDLEKLIENGSFSKIYCYLLIKLSNQKKKQFDTNLGGWIKYEQGTDHMPLVNSLMGHNTGWCTAGENTAKNQLKNGDFYVYYSYDENNNPTIPRIAIRMEGNSIAEIRGVAQNQNIESEIEEIVDKKLEEFPDKDKYKKKVSDMKNLTEIYNKHKSSQKLNIEELKFLYKIDEEIEGFGYQEDPRIKEIIKTRDIRNDLSQIFSCSENQISFTREEALKGNIIYHKGDLEFSNIENGEELILPQIVEGDLILRNLKNAKGLTFPKKIIGSLNLNKLEDLEGMKLPQEIGESLGLRGITNIKKIELPQKIGGTINLGNLISAEELIFPKKVGGSIYLENLIKCKRMILPQEIGWNLDLNSLENIEELKLPHEVGATLNLDSLREVKELVLPQTIGEDLFLTNLLSVEGLILPEKFYVSNIITLNYEVISDAEFAGNIRKCNSNQESNNEKRL